MYQNTKVWIVVSALILISGAFFLKYINVGKQKKTSNDRKTERVTITDTLPIKYETQNMQYQGIPRLLFFSGKSEKQIQDNEYFSLLRNRIISDELSAKSWFNNKCNEFWLGQQNDGKYFSIERHGYHQGGCPGDPMTSPRYDTFLIDTKSKKIFYDDVMTGKTITFEEWAIGIAKE